ncbi:hypothetical protein [Neobacillus sp.]|uniref:hypothetical protein n=1 Tax=Neobacillus sp. TaxID=2675273 RepID=UPI00289921EB|nr:hypothetical protein [Neobacillus sp.]
MKDTIKYVGLDVSKEKIAVAIADEGRDEPRYWGMIPNTAESIRKLVKKLGEKRIFECVMKLVQLAMVYIVFFLA